MTDPCRPNPSSPRPRTSGDDVTWTRSTHCGPSGGCVEVALDDGWVLVRDSKSAGDDDCPAQRWSPYEWCGLLATIKSDLRCDLPVRDSLHRLGFHIGSQGNAKLALARHDGYLLFYPDEWAAFTAGVKAGEFDLVRLLPEFQTSSGVGERSGDEGFSPAVAATGAGGGAVLPVPVAALPERPLVSESARVAARRAVRKVYDNGIFMTSMETGDVLEACADAAVDAFLEAIWGAAIAPLVSVEGAA